MKNYFVKLTFLSIILMSTTALFAQTFPANFSTSVFMGGWSEVEGFRYDATGQMYVYEKGGKVWVVDTNGVKNPTPLIDISEEVGNWRDHGLNGFALDPNFRTNGYFYLMYTVDRHHLMNYGTVNYNPATNQYLSATIIRVTRYTANSATNFTNTLPNTRLILIGETRKTGIPLLHESHSGGQLVFGTDGSLLITTGDGASYNNADGGSDGGTYYAQALIDSIIKPKENVGAFRSQLIDCLCGKLLRIDPATGNGLPTNPYYDAANPRAPKSRVWDLGLRNPFRMAIRPGTGSTDVTAGDPGAFYIGDVGWNAFEDLHVSTGPGLNFGWPLFEGLTSQSGYQALTVYNQDAPNPLYQTGGCTQQYFQFKQLCIQDINTPTPSFPNPCNTSIQIPSNIVKFKHARPAIDWQHGSNHARTGIWNGINASQIDLNNVASPVPGPVFSGNASCGGVWYTGTKYPVVYQNTYFHADYGQSWIKNFKFKANNTPDSVKDFGSTLGPVIFIEYNPKDQLLYYVKYPSDIYKISYNLSVNNPPTAVASQDIIYGSKPLIVNFTGSNSTDPENLPLTYSWNFGDGTPNSTSANPTHTFNPVTNNPIAYTVILYVTDNIGQTSFKTLKVYVNDTPPQVTITSFTNGGLFTMSNNTTVPLQANVFDAESADGLLKYSWRTYLHHNSHTHPEATDTNRITNTVLTPVGCDGNVFYYRMELTVTDPIGLSTTVDGSLYPACDAPVADFSSNKIAGCPGVQINFTDLSTNLPDSWSWTFTGGSPSSSIAKNPVVSYNSPGTYAVSLSSTSTRGTGSITKTGYITITTIPAPTITPNGPTTFCEGNSVLLSTSPVAVSYLWSTNETSQNILVNSNGNYQVTITDANNCTSTSIITPVIVNAKPTPVITPNGVTTFCEGQSVLLSSSPVSVSYLWSTSETSQNILVTTTGDYQVTVTDANNCTGTSSIIPILVNPKPSVTITPNGNTTFCENGSVTLSSSSAVSNLWSTNETSQNILVTTTGDYQVTVTDANNCTGTSSIVPILVNPKPSVTITPNGNTTFCENGSVSLSSSSAVSYLWSTNETSQNILVTTTGDYQVTVTDANNCSGTSTITSILVNPNPNPVITPNGATTFCQGGSVLLSTNPAAISYLWSTNEVSQNILVNSTGDYQVTVTDVNNCTGTSNIIGVNLITGSSPSTPGKITISTGISKACPGDIISYSIAPVPGATSYDWTTPLGGVITSGINTNNITITYNSNFTLYDTLRVTANNVCGSSAQKKIRINRNFPAIPGLISGPSSNLCKSINVAYSVLNVPGITYLWKSHPSATITSGQTTNAITVDFSSSNFSGYISVNAGNGCGSSASQKLAIKSAHIAADTIYGSAVVCPFTSYSYNVASDPTVSSYKWVGPSGSRITDGVTTSTTNSLTTSSNSVSIAFANLTATSSINIKKINDCSNSAAKYLTLTQCGSRVSSTSEIYSLELYPNPVSGLATIKIMSDNYQNCELSLLDISGRELMKETISLKEGLNNHSIDLNFLETGIYLVKFRTNNFQETIRIIKE